MRLSEFVLKYRLGEREWQIYRFSGVETRVGREADNHLILDHREISRHHFQIRFDDEMFQITDLGSSNGTQLDGITLTPQVAVDLRPGQMITVGDFVLLIAQASENGSQIAKEFLPFLLRFRFGTGTWQTFPIEPGQKILGRDPNCDFYLNDSEVSRHHAKLSISEDEIWLTDLSSTNGTQLGGVPLEPQKPYRLQLGQPFSIGNFVLQLDDPSLFYKAPSVVGAKRDSAAQGKSVSEKGIEAPMAVHALNLLSQERTTIGRAPDNDIVLPHPMISAHHAVIERDGRQLRIRDLGSTYGVFVNDRRITGEVALKDWDQIKIASTAFLISGYDLQQQAVVGLELETKNISNRVGSISEQFHEISIFAKPNEIVAILGRDTVRHFNLLRALMGDCRVSHGQISVNGLDYYHHYDLFAPQIGFVPENQFVSSVLTIEEALAYVARLRLPPDTTKEECSKLISDILKRLDLAESRTTPISQLSKFQSKLVSIGCELLTSPQLLFLNEPAQGLDPGEEFALIKLLRRLTTQGRTTIMVANMGQSLMAFDKLIILAEGGSLAYFGSPEGALDYFNQYRSDTERRTKEMTFADIYGMLADEKRGKPSDWRTRYLNSQSYLRIFEIDPSLADLDPSDPKDAIPNTGNIVYPKPRIRHFKQFRVLSVRYLRTLLRNKAALAFMLGLAPILGLLDLLWRPDLYDVYRGSADKIVVMWFMGAFSALFVGLQSSIQAFSSDVRIFQHERRTTLKLLPYYFSKMWVGIPLAVYQAGALLLLRMVLVQPKLPTGNALFTIFLTLFMTVMIGYLVGLVISLITPNKSTAVSLIAVVLLLQIIFAGALLPFDWIPGGRQISILVPVRWSYEAIVRASGFGEPLATEACQISLNQALDKGIEDSSAENCACIGISIFSDCADFPGVFANFKESEIRNPMEPSEAVVVKAEMIIRSFYQNYESLFWSSVFVRIIILWMMQLGLVGLGLFLLKSNDPNSKAKKNVNSRVKKYF